MSKKYNLVVLTNPSSADREDEFNKWYDEVHLGDVLKIDGIVSAQRFRMVDKVIADKTYRYCAIYEIEGEDPSASIEKLQQAAGTSAMPVSEALDPNAYAVLYEAIGPVVRG